MTEQTNTSMWSLGFVPSVSLTALAVAYDVLNVTFSPHIAKQYEPRN
jgi:hypothetical protein